MREGLPLPPKIANAPQLQMGLELYYDAFWELSTCRPTGWGLGPIPWHAMHEYAVAFGFDSEQRDWLFYLIRELDQAYLRHHAPKKGRSKSGGSSKWRPQGALGSSQRG